MVDLSGRPCAAVAEPLPGDLLPSRPIRVGFVLHVMQVAGAEMLVAEIIRRLGPRIEPTVLCLDGVGALGEAMRAEGVEVLNLGRRPGRDYRVAWRMARAVRTRRIEVVHAHQYTPFFYAALARLLAAGSFRLILTEHGRAYPDTVSPLRRAGNRWALGRQADAITGVCDFSIRALIRNDGFPADRVAVVENGIRFERYGPMADRSLARAAIGLDPARRHIACVARFHPVKDHPMLLRAFRRIAAEFPDVDLLLAGDGPLREDLADLSRSLEIIDRVHFLGVRSDVPDVLRAADVFALTSLSEAASLTLLEAMATCLPVAVTDVGGNPEIVRDGVDGLLVPRGDDVAMAAALGRLLSDPGAAEAMGQSGRQRIAERYRLESTIASYAGLYERLARAR